MPKPAVQPQPDAVARTTPLIEFIKVSKRFGSFYALRDITLSVGRGEVVVVLGPSGSGKSTLCRCANRLETIDGGQIRVDGRPQPVEGKELYKFRSEVGMVFQSFNLFSHKTVLDNVTMAPRKIHGLDRQQAQARAMQLLEQVGISSRATAYPAQLSGGQSQRAAIARALAMEPKVLLFDEPTSALDPEATQEVLTTMENLAESGTTMLVVTHEMGFACSAADRIVFMDAGQIVEVNDPETFFAAPATERAQAFLSHVR